jgi:hypothetical protein
MWIIDPLIIHLSPHLGTPTHPSTPEVLRTRKHTPTLKECEDDTHTPKMGTWESSRTPKNSEFDCRGQNISPWGVPYTIGKVLKRRCRKWPCMSHSDIYSTSYVWKKGRESKWQFDSWPLKVKNRPDSPSEVCTRSYALSKSRKSQLLQFRDSHLGVSGQNAIWMSPLWSGA